MIERGVPKMALVPKLNAEGLDPTLLDTPNAPVPDGGIKDEPIQDDSSEVDEESDMSSD